MNLVLDEKKMRRGPSIGLPYVGSKKKISKKIVEIIKQNFGTNKTVYDVFGGGGAITCECLLNNLNVVYNDADPIIVNILKRVLSENREWIKTLIIDREEFFRIKEKKDKTVDDHIKLLINSFGNNSKDYLYSKKICHAKYKLALAIIKKENTFKGYKQTRTYKNFVKNSQEALGFKNKEEKDKILQQLRQVEQLPRLQQLERLQQAEKVSQVKSFNKDYHYFSSVKNAILYLDPPYENTKTDEYNHQVDYTEFYNWVVKMSKNNIVLLSSYEVSDPRFRCVYEFKKARSTIQTGSNGKRCEKLFTVKQER